MSGWGVARWTGAAGVAGTVIQVVGFLAFLPAGTPPKGEAAIVTYLHNESGAIETSTLLFFIGFAALFVFFAGLRTLLIEAGTGMDYLATAVFGLGAASVILGYVSLGLLGAAAAAGAAAHPDNAAVDALFVGAGVIGGAPSAVLFAAFLGIAGSALSRSRLLPGWSVWLSWITSILVLATVPALYGGDDASGFYTANGIVTLLALLPLYVWTLAVSIAIYRKPAAS